jgi:hypothetical protein
MRALLLAYGGVAVLQWLRIASGAMDDVETAPAYTRWLRDGTLVLPFVALAVVLVSRRAARMAGSAGLGLAALYSVIMGASSIMRQLFPENAHAAHEGALPTTGEMLQTAFMAMVVSAVYALFVEWLVEAFGSTVGGAFDRLPVHRRFPKAAFVLLAIMVATPAFAFTSGERAVAATAFPDQVIHPRGSLLLIARVLSDGTMAYIAPDFGANGTRPTIEMTEGETLNITLKNELSNDVSLHVHGVHYNIDSDGTRHSGSFARPGQQRVYQWRAAPGTAGYWHYHDHVIGDDEGTGGVLGGLYGALVVRKPGDPRPVKTFVIVGQDKTLNGRIYPDTPTYTAKQGELVEWVVVSHGNRVHTFHLHGHHWLTPARGVSPDWNAAVNAGSGKEDNHILAPGDSFGFMVIAGDDVGPGMWMYHCHFQDHAGAMKGFFQVLPAGPSAQGETSRTFPETGKTVAGRFLEYWNLNGGLAQQGYPLSDEFTEKSDLDGKTYKVQYFERAVFEYHPENAKPYDVLLSQLGTFRYKEKYPGGR